MSTLEQVIVRAIVAQSPEGPGGATLKATRAMVQDAVEVNAAGRAAKVRSLANHLRGALCSVALHHVGDQTRADLVAVHQILDSESAAVAAFNLREYRDSIDWLPPDSRPGTMQLREAAKRVLEETSHVLDLLAEPAATVGLSDEDEVAAGRHAANALCAAYDVGIVMGLPVATQALLYALQRVTLHHSLV